MYSERPSIMLTLGWGAACLMMVGSIAIYEGCKKVYFKTKNYLNKSKNS